MSGSTKAGPACMACCTSGNMEQIMMDMLVPVLSMSIRASQKSMNFSPLFWKPIMKYRITERAGTERRRQAVGEQRSTAGRVRWCARVVCAAAALTRIHEGEHHSERHLDN